MVLIWPRTLTCEPRGRECLRVGDQPVDLGGDVAEIGAVGSAVDVDDRSGVVVAHDRRASCCAGRWHRFASSCAVRLPGPVTGVVARSVSEARRNCGVWATTGYWVPVFGSIQKDSDGLGAARQRHQQVRGDVGLGQPQQRRLAAIDVDVERRIVEGLLDAQVHDARDLVQAGEQGVGVGAVAIDVEAGHLHVERRRQAEIEDLADDVRRQEGEARGRVTARSAARAAGARTESSDGDARVRFTKMSASPDPTGAEVE